MPITRLALIRHGRTEWNEDGRIQGRQDIPLSQEGHAELETRIPPSDLAEARWFTSPLARCRKTAELLGNPGASVEPRLVEMAWGDWEGEVLTDLRASDPEAMSANEARGRFFEPPGGETPADVQERVSAWISMVAPSRAPLVAVTHKGVIMAMLAMVLDWDMLGPPPAKLNWSAMHYFTIAMDGQLDIERLNVPLGEKPLSEKQQAAKAESEDAEDTAGSEMQPETASSE